MIKKLYPAIELKDYKKRKIKRRSWVTHGYVEFKNGKWRESYYDCATSSYKLSTLNAEGLKELKEHFKEPVWEYYDEEKQIAIEQLMEKIRKLEDDIREMRRIIYDLL